MKSIYINRNITLSRAGEEDLVLPKGNHTVTDEVAEHPFVKFHTESVADAPAGNAELQALLDQTRLAAAAEIEQLQSQLAAARVKVSEQDAILDHAQTTIAELRTALTVAQSKIAEQDAALAAHAAMQTPVETKAKK